MSGFAKDLEATIPALRRYARALLRDNERGEDLLQDSLERALSRRHLFLWPSNLVCRLCRYWLRMLPKVAQQVANATRTDFHP